MQFLDLVELRPYFAVKHHIPGRLRLKFNLSVLSRPEAQKIIERGDRLPAGIDKLRINKYARSMILEYDNKIIDFDLLQKLLDADNDEEGKALLSRIEKNIEQGEKNAN